MNDVSFRSIDPANAHGLVLVAYICLGLHGLVVVAYDFYALEFKLVLSYTHCIGNHMAHGLPCTLTCNLIDVGWHSTETGVFCPMLLCILNSFLNLQGSCCEYHLIGLP